MCGIEFCQPLGTIVIQSRSEIQLSKVGVPIETCYQLSSLHLTFGCLILLVGNPTQSINTGLLKKKKTLSVVREMLGGGGECCCTISN